MAPFSVGEGKQVYFSRGNLQYKASTDTWRFAERQTDAICYDNASAGPSYDGWIDLFGWGTSGYDNTANDPYAINYMPWSSLTEISGGTGINKWGCGPSTNQPDINLEGSSANYDWGVYNAISNGGNRPGLWRTLSADEWQYLLTGRTNAENLYSKAYVEGMYGVILLPDDFVLPSGINWVARASDGITNSYNQSEWMLLEALGAVFLPAAGVRDTPTYGCEQFGDYWTSTAIDYYYAKYLEFGSGGTVSLDDMARGACISVRLVQDSSAQSQEEPEGPVEPEEPAELIEGELQGEFSVSATKKVHFSQGNLQYVGTWQFAEHQWDYFGDNQYDDHRDLFGWGTGDAPNEVGTDYSAYYDFTDWGANTITNGGNDANLWRTLTQTEWVYLFNNRAGAGDKYGAAKVNGITGIVLLPDNWTLPSGCGFTAGMTDGSWSVATTNIYDTSHWAQMESAGAVFLPAAGYRNGTGVINVGSYGIYWSASHNGTAIGLDLLFVSGVLNPRHGSDCYRGHSVRLVR